MGREDGEGHGCFWVGAGGGEVRRAFWAKVVGRSVEGGCGGLEDREEKGEELFELGEEEKGFVGWGFGVLEDENGFSLELAEVGKVELKRLLPRFEGVLSLLDVV